MDGSASGPIPPQGQPIMALARFDTILAEHQQMSVCIDMLCELMDVKSKKDRLNCLIHHARQADAAFRFLPDAKAWLRAISLEFPETKGRVNEALAEMQEQIFNFDAGSEDPS